MTKRNKKKTNKVRQLSLKQLFIILVAIVIIIAFAISLIKKKPMPAVQNPGHEVQSNSQKPAKEIKLPQVQTTPASVAPRMVEKKESVFKVSPPSIDSISLGQQKSVEDFVKAGYLTEPTNNAGFIAFKETKYNLYEQVASITFEAQNNVVNKLTFHFESVDNQKLINTIYNAYNFDKKYCLGTNCNVLIQGDRVNMTLFTTSGLATIVYVLK